MPVNHKPDGYHSVTPYLYIRGAANAIEFYKKAFGAEELFRLPDQEGRIGHAELRIGDSVVMLADEYPKMKIVGPQTLGGTSVGLLVYVPDVDTIVGRALAQGAKLDRPIQDQFYGDRSGTVVDPYGHKWTIATHIEDVPPEEMEERAKKAMQTA
jgi:PhnB protein